MTNATFAARGICTLLAAGAAAPSFAAPKIVPMVTVSGGGQYSSNPFLTPGDSPDGFAASVEVAPSIEIIDDRTQATISGNVGFTQYLGDLGDLSAYRVQGLIQHRATDRLSLTARVGFDSSILGARGFNDPVRVLPFAPAVDAVPGTGTTAGTPTTPLPAAPPLLFGTNNPALGLGSTIVNSDLGLLGVRQRRNLANASFGLDYRVSARSSFSAEANFSKGSFPGAAIITQGFTTYGATIEYRRAVSERTTIGVGLAVSRINYAQSPATSIYSPRVSISQRLSGGFSLNASAGVAIVRQANTSTTSPFVDASLCRARVRSSLCLAASYAPSTTGIGSVRNQLGVSANYSYRLAERSSLSASVGYSQLTAERELLPTAPVNGPFVQRDPRAAQSFLTSDVVLNRRLSRTVAAYVGASYRKLFDNALDVNADYGVRFGLSVTVGGRR